MLIKRLSDKIDSVIEEFGLDLKANSLTRFGLLVDLLTSHVLYGVNVTDYFLHKFYNLKPRAKKMYMTQWDRMYMMCKINGMENFDLFEDKGLFFQKYGKYMGRTACVLTEGEEAYLRWLENNPAGKYIFKPAGGCCGQGIFVLPQDSEKVRDYSWLTSQDEALVAEPYIENCEELKKVYPGTLNTLRVCTLRSEGKPVIIGCYLRMGVAGIATDNYSNGGVLAEVDLDSGVVITTAINKKGKRYAFHPDSGEQIVGLRIPMWKEVQALVMEVAEVTPEVVYSAWDIAVLPNGPVLIEGNIGGDVDLQQTPQGIGKRALYEPYLPKRRHWHFGFNTVTTTYRKHMDAKKSK